MAEERWWLADWVGWVLAGAWVVFFYLYVKADGWAPWFRIPLFFVSIESAVLLGQWWKGRRRQRQQLPPPPN
jgi:hypothetical protein